MHALLLSYALSGAAGLRAPLTLLAVSIAVHTGHLHPSPSLAWVGSTWVMLLAAAVTMIDFLADKLPGIDHVMHTVHMLLAPVIGAVAAMSGNHGDQSAAMLIGLLGAGNALLVHGARAGARVASTGMTLGTGNTFMSLAEDGIAGVLIVTAFVAPVLAAVLLVLLTVQIARLARWLAKRGTARVRTP